MSDSEDRDRIGEMIQSHYPALIRFIRRKWRGEDSAEDLLNDVVERIFRRPELKIPMDVFTAYLYRAVSNRIIDLLRKKPKPRESLDKRLGESGLTLTDLIEDFRFDPEHQLFVKELKEQLKRALVDLKEEERAVVVETEIHGIPFRQLAEQWDIPVGTLLSRKQRALKKMKKFIEKETRRNI